MKIFLLYFLTIALVQGIPQCKDEIEKVSNLHGEILLPSQDITITVCNSSTVIQNRPISISSYQEYLKIQNNLQKVFANTFSLMPKVETLIVSNIGLTTIENHGLKGLVNLKYLNLEGNLLQNLPETLFDDAPNIIEVNLENNRLNVIHIHQFDKLINLKKLKLAKNQISDIPIQWHTGLHNLVYLSLSNNKLTILKNGMFERLTSLDTLRLDHNDITTVQNGAFRGLSGVSSLTLHFNRNIAPQHFLEEIKSLRSLKGLSISPPSLECGVWEELQDWTNEANVDLVQIPAERVCWTV